VPGKRTGPQDATPETRPDDAPGVGNVTVNLQAAAVRGRRCCHCAGPLPPRRRRFCSDPCRRRGQKAERVTENDRHAAAVVRQIRPLGVRASIDLDALEWLAEAVADQWEAISLWARSPGVMDTPGSDDIWARMSWALMQRADMGG
jgi:hypothetical protein